MKLSNINKEIVLPIYENYKLNFNPYPFYCLYISPSRNPFGLFDFCIHQLEYSFKCYMFKTCYYQSAVIQKEFNKDATLDEVISWINEVISKIKQVS